MIFNGSSLMAWCAKETGKEEGLTTLGFSTNHQLTVNHEVKDLQHKDASGSGRWAAYGFGQMSWQITSSNFLANTTSVGDAPSKSEMKREGLGAADLYDIMQQRKPVFVAFGIEGSSKDIFTDPELTVPDGGWKLSEDKHLEGWAYISSLEINAPVGDYASFNVTFQGTGPLELKKGAGDDAAWMSAKEPVPVPVTATTAKATAAEKK